jgi:hypothetical protein
MASTVTLQGGAANYTLPVGKDAVAAITAAIQTEFTGAKSGSFTVIDPSGSADISVTAGKQLQGIFDLGLGQDTLIGGLKTTLIYGNADDTQGDSISVVGKTTVFGTAGADTLSVTNGSATAYLEGGKNIVSLAGKSDTLSVAGTGGASIKIDKGTKASIVGGAADDTVRLSTGAATVTAGSGSMSVIGGTGQLTFTHGVGGDDTVNVGSTKATDFLTGAAGDKAGSDLFTMNIKGSGKYIIDSFSSTRDTISITGASKAQIAAALKNAHTIKGGEVVTIGKDHITVIGGGLTSKNFV